MKKKGAMAKKGMTMSKEEKRKAREAALEKERKEVEKAAQKLQREQAKAAKADGKRKAAEDKSAQAAAIKKQKEEAQEKAKQSKKIKDDAAKMMAKVGPVQIQIGALEKAEGIDGAPGCAKGDFNGSATSLNSIHQETADAVVEDDPEPLSFNMDNVRTPVKKAQDSMSIIRGFLRKTGQ